MDTTASPDAPEHQTASLAHRPHTSGSSVPTPQPVQPSASAGDPRVSHGASWDGAGTSSRSLSPKPVAHHESSTASACTTLQKRNPKSANNPAVTRKHPGRTARDSRKPICKFFGSKKGCKSGDACQFRHEAPPQEDVRAAEHRERGQDAVVATASANLDQRKTQPKSTIPSLSQAVQVDRRNQRSYQISQIRIRFSAVEEVSQNGASVLKFGMQPSDPDFPFDMNILNCVITVPPERDGSYLPSLRVTNDEMERGYQLNVEQGFHRLWAQQARPTLLNTMKLLDNKLETLLTVQKAEVIRIIANAGPKSSVSAPADADTPAQNPPAVVGASMLSHDASLRSRPTPAQLEAARQKRNTETHMLEHRLGRTPSFTREADGTAYVIPLEPRRRNELPPSLAAVKTVRLYVPVEYDVEPCSIELIGVAGEASRAVEAAFITRAKEHREATLMGHVNYFAQNLHFMASVKDILKPKVSNTSTSDKLEPPSAPATPIANEQELLVQDTDKAHVKRIMRPPEWDARHESGDEESSTDDEREDGSITDHESSEDEEVATEDVQNAITSTAGSTSRNTGILLILPDLQLHNIELLELTSLSLTVRCSRCRESHDLHAVKPTPLPSTTTTNSSSSNTVRTIACRKCSQHLTASYTPELLHSNTTHAAHLDLDNCDPLDLLPSNFTPTCAACSTTYTSPGISSARGASDSLAICRGCHSRMLFAMPSIHFLRLGGDSTLQGLPRKAVKSVTTKEKLGIVTGTPLPRNGACTHYRKSHRWFRFSCCDVVHACDKCHDAAPPPPNTPKHTLEFANRMICGYCSREQNYRPESCGVCGANLVGRKGRGFWEGGEGTRDPTRMSRKDPRKRKLLTRVKRERAKAKEKNEKR